MKAFANERRAAWSARLEGAFPALRRRPGRGAGGQPEGAGGAPRPGHARGGVQRAVRGVRGVLGVSAAGLRAVPGADQGKDENGVRYVKRNAIAGHRFETLGALDAHLAWWMREIADVRRHGTTGETAGRMNLEPSMRTPLIRSNTLLAISMSSSASICSLTDGNEHTADDCARSSSASKWLHAESRATRTVESASILVC